MNPAVFCDPQVIPQLVPPRGRGRPTIYSEELIDEFCGLIVDGMTVARACKEAGMPSKRTIKYWLKQYPEFRREFEEAVIFRNQCWMDDAVDIARAPMQEGESIARRRLECDMLWAQLKIAGLKAVAKPGDDAKLVGEEKVPVVEYDPIRGKLYEWELEYQRRRQAKANGQGNGHDANGQGR
jgi:hypothetical protein